jgi:DNA phosphorothioation-associated DGQHR protein 1
MVDFPHITPALLVKQPIGEFYVSVLPADLLLQVAASDVMSAALNPDGKGYSLSGTQRVVQDKRLVQIADYIDRIDAAFPNSIILAANYDRELGLDVDEAEAIEHEDAEDGDAAEGEAAAAPERSEKAWSVEQAEDGCYRLLIPTNEKLAAIIDGQHRLFAFTKADSATRLSMPLVCAVFLDLPKPLQAQIFATINSTQKPVDRSLTFELFGYNVEEERESFWSPDKLAVFLTRKLGTEQGSPLKGRVSVAPKRDVGLQELVSHADWTVSTAVVVDGILRLISSNPKRDSNAMRTPDSRPRSVLAEGPKDRSPLRQVYIDGNDALIYAIVENYLRACETKFWAPASPASFIRKTVGVQDLFDVLRKIALGAVESRDIRVVAFEERLAPAATIDFAAEQYRVPSGSGRSIIRRAIEDVIVRDWPTAMIPSGDAGSVIVSARSSKPALADR